MVPLLVLEPLRALLLPVARASLHRGKPAYHSPVVRAVLAMLAGASSRLALLASHPMAVFPASAWRAVLVAQAGSSGRQPRH